MEKAMAPHSSTLAWKIPWMEEPGRLQSMGSLSRTQLSDFTFSFHFHPLEKEMATHFAYQFSSVAQSCLTFWDPMNRSPPGFPVHHQLPEFTELMSIESVMPSSHPVLCRPLLLPPPAPPSIRGFSKESVVFIRWPE